MMPLLNSEYVYARWHPCLKHLLCTFTRCNINTNCGGSNVNCCHISSGDSESRKNAEGLIGLSCVRLMASRTISAVATAAVAFT